MQTRLPVTRSNIKRVYAETKGAAPAVPRAAAPTRCSVRLASAPALVSRTRVDASSVFGSAVPPTSLFSRVGEDIGLDVLVHLRERESLFGNTLQPDYLANSPDITPTNFTNAVRWLTGAVSSLHLSSATLATAAHLFARFVAVRPVAKHGVSLVLNASLLLSHKFHTQPTAAAYRARSAQGVPAAAIVAELVGCDPNARANLFTVEAAMLNWLEFRLAGVLPIDYVASMCGAAQLSSTGRYLAFYLIELALTDHRSFARPASRVAAAAVALALALDTDTRPSDPAAHTRYAYEELEEDIQLLVDLYHTERKHPGPVADRYGRIPVGRARLPFAYADLAAPKSAVDTII